MTTLKAFSKSEDAYTLATLLSSEGLDAVVVDEASLGGNLLGATNQAIRIEVPEDQLEAAREIIEREPVIPQESERHAAELGGWTRNWFFDAMVLADLVLILTGLLVPRLFFITPPFEVEQFLLGQTLSEGLWQVAYDVHGGFVAISCVANLMILYRLKLGRILYVGTAIWAGITFLCYPPDIQTPFGAFLNFFWVMLIGAIVTAMFLPPVRDEFRKRLTDS